MVEEPKETTWVDRIEKNREATIKAIRGHRWLVLFILVIVLTSPFWIGLLQTYGSQFANSHPIGATPPSTTSATVPTSSLEAASTSQVVATFTITTSTVYLKNYSVIASNYQNQNGVDSVEFSANIFHPLQIDPIRYLAYEPNGMSCSFVSNASNNPEPNQGEVMGVYILNCTSPFPIYDDGKLFKIVLPGESLQSPVPTSSPYAPYSDIVINGSGTQLVVTGATVSSSITDCATVKPFIQNNGNTSATVVGNQYSGPCPEQILNSSGTITETISSNTETVTPQ
jgi:hypothetical protein